MMIFFRNSTELLKKLDLGFPCRGTFKDLPIHPSFTTVRLIIDEACGDFILNGANLS